MCLSFNSGLLHNDNYNYEKRLHDTINRLIYVYINIYMLCVCLDIYI